MDSLTPPAPERSRISFSTCAFTACIALISAPFLTPCAIGVIQGPVRGIQALTDSGHKEEVFTTPETPPLAIREHSAISRTLLITNAQLRGAECKNDRSALQKTGLALAGIAITAAVMVDMSVADPQMGLDFDLSEVIRGKLLVSDQPRVELRGVEICHVSPKQRPRTTVLARAEHDAKISVRDSSGSYFAIANRIHYHAVGRDAVLEGNVIVRCGGQTIKAPQGLVRLDIANHRIESSGPLSVMTSP